MKDLFSTKSSDYAKFRPRYPAELFDKLAKLAPSLELAWDCGTGNGQAAIELATRFNHVIAMDISESQLENAEKHANIKYRRGSVEKSGLTDGSVDLVTVAQAYHWFNHKKFHEEVARVAKPGGIFAVWTYATSSISPEVDAAVMKFYTEITGPYWEPERRHVENGYRSIEVPFKELTLEPIYMRAKWTLQNLIGYLGTWSAVKKYQSVESRDPLELIMDELKKAWGSTVEREVKWPLGLRVFKI